MTHCKNPIEVAAKVIGHQDGSYVSALYEALPHLCTAYIRADLHNQAGALCAIAHVYERLCALERKSAAEAIIFDELPPRERGGRGTELLERIAHVLEGSRYIEKSIAKMLKEQPK